MKKIDWKALTSNLLIPLAVGGFAALLTADSMQVYDTFTRPPLSPPGWLFPVVWTALYLLMGYSAYRIRVSDASRSDKARALVIYAFQLGINFLWPILFFSGQMLLTAFLVLLLLWLLVLATMVLFSPIDQTAGTLLLPYLLWVTFAGYLNYGIYLLN